MLGVAKTLRILKHIRGIVKEALKSRKENEEWLEFLSFIEELKLESKTDSEGDFDGTFT